jgi:hypothetical protein
MTTKELLAGRPERLTNSEIMEATGVDNDAMARINMYESMRANGDLLMYETHRVGPELVWTLWWREKREGRRLLAARTNLEQ